MRKYGKNAHLTVKATILMIVWKTAHHHTIKAEKV